MQPNDTARPCRQCGALFTPFPAAAGFYCSRPCYSTARVAASVVNIEARFWSHVNRDSDCWIWEAAMGRKGYGCFVLSQRRKQQAHRFAWELATGETLTEDEWVLHSCDRPACVRNDDEGTYEVNGVVLPRRGHLFKGNNAINVADMVSKGRDRLRGAQHGNAILTDHDVREIRASTDTGMALAERYGVSRPTISQIRSRKSWQHLA